MALLACAVGVWLLGQSRGASTKAPVASEAPHSRPAIASPQSRQIANFAVLRGPPEGLPARTKKILKTPKFGVNWALAQRLSVAVPGDFWAIPGNGFLCVVAQVDIHSTAQSCATTDNALTHGVATVLIRAAPSSGPAPGSRLIVGIAPDRAREALVVTAGSVTTTPVSGNIFVLRDSATEPPESATLQ